MGQSKGSDYNREPTKTSGQISALEQFLAQSLPGYQQAAQGYQQFLPGGGGGQAITAQANKNFQQNTLPSIMNAFGSGSKNSSALNQALASGAANLNTDLASQLSQLQLQAAQGMGNLAGQQAQLGQQDQFALSPKKPPLWQQYLGTGLDVVGNVAGAALGGGWNNPGQAAVQGNQAKPIYTAANGLPTGRGGTGAYTSQQFYG